MISVVKTLDPSDSIGNDLLILEQDQAKRAENKLVVVSLLARSLRDSLGTKPNMIAV